MIRISAICYQTFIYKEFTTKNKRKKLRFVNILLSYVTNETIIRTLLHNCFESSVSPFSAFSEDTIFSWGNILHRLKVQDSNMTASITWNMRSICLQIYRIEAEKYYYKKLVDKSVCRFPITPSVTIHKCLLVMKN